MPDTKIKRDRMLNDIRYFESPSLPSHELPTPRYMGDFFVQPASSVAFGQLIGGKCLEAKLTIRGGSALYILFTPAIAQGEMQRLAYTTEAWQTWLAYGLNESFNKLGPQEQSSLVRTATFAALRFLAPDFLAGLQDMEDKYRQQGSLLRVRYAEKVARGYSFVVAGEVRPLHETSRLWLEVTDLANGRHAELCLVSLENWNDGPFLAQKITTSKEGVAIHPYTSAQANYYTKKYRTPLHVSFDQLSFQLVPKEFAPARD